MKKGYTKILFIIDKSGSMSNLRNDVIGGFNSFIEDQKKVEEGTVDVSLIQFDDIYEVNYVNKPLNEVEPLNHQTYCPRGSTALYDTIAKGVNELGATLRNMKEEDRPEKVIVIIQTDGQENASKEFNIYNDGANKVKAMIEEQTNKYSWEFVFMGAKIDAVQTATDLGIKSCNAMKFADNAMGTSYAYESLSNNLRSVRCGCKADMSYTSADYAAQDTAGVN